MNPDLLNIPLFQSPWFIPLIIWSLIWKGIALYRAGYLRDKWWFIALLIINTFGILEIVYFFVFSRRGEKPTKNLPDQN